MKLMEKIPALKTAVPVLLCILILAEAAAYLFYYNISIPAQVKEEYLQAQSQNGLIDTEINRLESYQREHQYPYEALSILLVMKPEGIGYQSIMIAGFDDGAWMKLRMEGEDGLLNDYLASLSLQDWVQSIRERNGLNGRSTLAVDIRRKMP